MAGDPFTEERASFRRIRTGAITFYFTSISTAITEPGSVRVIRRAGQGASRASCICLQQQRPIRCSSWASLPPYATGLKKRRPPVLQPGP
jgi:hypothetical protein